jgi:hypothetical protein
MTTWESVSFSADGYLLGSYHPPHLDRTHPHFFNAVTARDFLTLCRNPLRPFDYMVKAGQPAPPKVRYRRSLMRYLVAIHHPDDYDPSVAEGEAIPPAIVALNKEMVAAGIRIFVGGLNPASRAKSLRAQPNGEVLITDGPYLETKEHVGGFWVLEAATLDEALAWGRKAVVACRAPVEVRAFN